MQCMHKFGSRNRRGGSPQAPSISKKTRLAVVSLTYLNGITIAIYRSAAMMQRFEMEITANCHDTIPRRTLSHERDFSQKYVPGKKRRTKEKSAAASDGTNQFVDV